MTPTIVRILPFCLIPAGIFLLLQGIKLIRKSMGGVVLLQMPLMQTEAQINIAKDGNYAIWQKGKYLQRMAVNMPVPDIYNESTGARIQLQVPFTEVRTNDGSNGRIRMFTFYATSGQYRYQLSSATPASWLQKLRTSDRVDPTKCFLEIKESRPAGLMISGILITILAAFCIIIGIVLAANFRAMH